MAMTLEPTPPDKFPLLHYHNLSCGGAFNCCNSNVIIHGKEDLIDI